MTTERFQPIDASMAPVPPEYGNHLLPTDAQQQAHFEWQETEEVQLRDYLDVILRRKWLIATVLMLVFLSTLIFTLAATRIYEASAVVEVSQQTPHVTTFQEVLGSEIQAREFYETQVELIGSRAMIDRVIDKLDLLAHPVVKNAVFGKGRDGILNRLGHGLKSLVGNVFRGQTQSAVSGDIAAQQQGIANAGALSRAISRSNDAFDAALTQSWKTRQQAEDRASREFSEYIRGTENYNDPTSGHSVELPGGYDHAWANSLGEYVLSNNAGFDPNQHSNNDWVAIDPVR